MNSVFVGVTVASMDAGAEPTWTYSRVSQQQILNSYLLRC